MLHAANCLLALRLPLPQFDNLHVFIMSCVAHMIACSCGELATCDPARGIRTGVASQEDVPSNLTEKTS
jgi:hypothetical protein